MSNLVYNKEKTKELIENLKAKGHIVTENDLSALIRKSGVIVRESIGRKRSFIEVSAKLYGVNLAVKETATQEFFKSHVKKGKLSFIPDNFERELMNLEGRVRIARRRACIGFDEKFMTMEDYKVFEEKFEKWKEEYFLLRDKIVEPTHWENMIQHFTKSLRSSAKDLNSLDQEILIENVLKRIPTREAYADSFYMKLNLDAFPVADNLAMFTPEIQSSMQESVNENAIKAMYQMLGNQLNDMFAQAAKIIVTIKKDGVVKSRLLKGMGKIAIRIRKNNLLDNDVLAGLADEGDALSKLSDRDDVLEETEELLLKLFMYADDLQITDTLDWLESPYTEKELKDKAMEKSQINEQKKALQSIYQQVSISINHAFKAATSLLNDVINEKAITEDKISIFNELSKSLNKGNLAAKEQIVKIANLTNNMTKLNLKDIDLVAEKAEELIANIYLFAIELKVEKDIDLSDSPFNREELEDLIKFL